MTAERLFYRRAFSTEIKFMSNDKRVLRRTADVLPACAFRAGFTFGMARRLEELALLLRDLSGNEEVQERVILAHGHLMLIALLEPVENDSKMSEHVTQALISLSFKRPDRKQMLLEAGILLPTLALLQRGTSSLPRNMVSMRNAVVLVSNLAKLPAANAAIRKHDGAVRLLVSLLATHSEVATRAANALNTLCENKSGAELIWDAGAVSALVALLDGEAAGSAAGVLRSLTSDIEDITAVRLAGAISRLVKLLREPEADAAVEAAGTLLNMVKKDDPSKQVILGALATCPPPPPCDEQSGLADLLELLQPIAIQRLAAAEAGTNVEEVQEALNQAKAVRVGDEALRSAKAWLDKAHEAAMSARRIRCTSLGLDELDTPREFMCPITCDVMQDPTVASDGHTYERSAIERVLALPGEQQTSPLTREILIPIIFPNIALKRHIAAFEQDAFAIAEKAAKKVVDNGSLVVGSNAAR